MKLLKRLILFILASEVDFFLNSEGYNYKPYEYLYWRFKGKNGQGYQQSSIRDACLQLTDTGEIDKITRNEVPLFRLTSKGRDRLLSFFTISIGQKKVWDRMWRIAVIGSEELGGRSGIRELGVRGGPRRRKTEDGRYKERTKDLRKLKIELKKMGFRKLSRGIYLTPLPISARLREFLLSSNFTAQVAVIESRRLLIGDDKQLAKQIWSLEKLILDYNVLSRLIVKLLTGFKKGKTLINKDKINIFLIYKLYFTLLSEDPGLPKKLLPNDWPLDLVKNQFLELTQRISQL